MEIPVYLFTGFLEAGKTKFIQETLENPEFDTGENTRVIVCEEGVEDFEKDKFKVRNVTFEYIDEPDDVNQKNFIKIAKNEKEGIFLHFNIKKPGRIRYGEAEESYGVGNHRG